MISLLSFVRTGQLGDVALGAPRSEVEEKLGTPNDWAYPEDVNQSPIWKYGNVELHFSEDVVFLIFCDNFYIPDGASFAFDASELGQGTEKEVEFWLRNNEIPFEHIPCYWTDELSIFRAKSDVEIKVYTQKEIFANESNMLGLCSISCVRR